MNRIIITLVTIAIFSSCGKKADETNLPEPGELISVKVEQVKLEGINNRIVTTGLLATDKEARLSFKISGVIDKILVSDGQNITKGQLLATLKVTEINAQVEQASLSFQKAKRDFARVDNLYKDSVATLEQWQNAKTGLDMAARAVESVAFNQEFASIHASATGFVSKKMANEGEVIEPGTPVMITNATADSGDWILKVGVTDEEWTAISVNQKAEVKFDAFPGKQFAAVVYRKLLTADQTSGSFQVELKVSFNAERPAVGMFGTAAIMAGTTNQALTIPHEALMQADGDKAFVFVPQSDNSVKKVSVVIQSFSDKSVAILSGIEAGTKVIISNTAFLNEHSKVDIIN